MKNLKKHYKTIFLLLITQVCFGQGCVKYIFETNHSYHKMKNLKEVPLVFSVDEVVYEKEVKVGKIAIINENYFYLQREIDELVRDSIYYHDELNDVVKRHDDFSQIKSLISDFVASSESFSSKKDKLILAQSLSDDNELDLLLYADEKNTEYEKMKYAVLQIDDEGLNSHLIRISKDLENLYAPLPFSKLNHTSAVLNRYRRVIKGVSKNNYVDGGYKNVESHGIVINNSVNGVKTFQGEFEELGVHYILNKKYDNLFVEGDIINEATAIKYCLIEKGYTSSPKILMEQITKRDLYLADFNFINQYSYSINGRYNHVNSYMNNIANAK